MLNYHDYVIRLDVPSQMIDKNESDTTTACVVGCSLKVDYMFRLSSLGYHQVIIS